MISGTSKIWTKSGPVDLVIITKMLQNIQENMESSWKHIIFTNLGRKKSKKIRTNACHVYKFFVLCVFLNIFWVYILYIIFYEDEERKWLISINKINKSLDMNFISIRKHELETWYFLYLGEGMPIFYYQGRAPNFFIFKNGNHITLNSRLWGKGRSHPTLNSR